MKTLVRWAARLYPAAWRARYATRKMRNEFIRVQQVQAGPDGGAIAISFRYPDRYKAQAVTRDLVNRFFIVSPNTLPRYWTPPATRRRRALPIGCRLR
jgi:hypothetical protein